MSLHTAMNAPRRSGRICACTGTRRRLTDAIGWRRGAGFPRKEGERSRATARWALFCVAFATAYMVLHISMPQLVEEVPRPLRNVMDSVALTSVFAGALALVRFKEETFDDMPPSIRDDILSHFFISDAEIVEIEAEKEQNETSIERSRVELEMEAKATLAKFNNRAPKRTSGTEKTNA